MWAEGGTEITELTITRGHDIIGAKIKLANNFFRRFIGLMLKKELLPGEGLLLQNCRQIHTFFMRMEIDAVFLDGDNRIAALIPNMARGNISPYIKKARHVLELPKGTIERYGLEREMSLNITESKETY